ncbi:MAG: response regulator transcription factor [Chloroflexota bacterium]
MGNSTGKITLVIADDAPATRAGIRAMAEKAGDIEVVGEAQDGFEVQKLVKDLCPQVLTLDLKMPGPFKSSVELQMWLHENCPGTAVLPYTGHGRDALLAQLKEAGAAGYVEKSASPETLIGKIRLAAAGVTHFDPEQEETAERWNEEVGKKWKSLSKREHLIALWITTPATNRGIAQELNLSERTVESHVRNVLTKLDMKTRQEAALWILKHFPEEVGGAW